MNQTLVSPAPRPVSRKLSSARVLAPLPVKGKPRFERLRRPLSYAMALLLIAALWVSPVTAGAAGRMTETAMGLVFVVIAVLGRLWSSLYIAGRKNSELCIAGPYALTRNPLYVFSSAGLFGVLLATHRPLVALVALGVFWVFYHFVIRSEERRLATFFGEAFEDYCRKVPRVIPRFARIETPEVLHLNLRPVMRGFGEVVWFFAAWLGALLVFGL